MSDLLRYTTAEILQLYKAAYYDQNEQSLQIGSQEFAAASVHAYVLGVLVTAFNHAALQCSIDTATGEFLDGIASSFGLSRPGATRASAPFTFSCREILHIPAGGLKVSNSQGNILFLNEYPFITVVGGNSIVLYSDIAGSEYNNIPAGTLQTVVEGAFALDLAQVEMSGGGLDAVETSEAGDNKFRAWLKLQIQALQGAGTAAAYEARARLADPRVIDVYCLRNSDLTFVRGKVAIFVVAEDNAEGVVERVRDYCSADDFRPVGDFVEVKAAPVNIRTFDNFWISVFYEPRFLTLARARNERILAEYNAELRRNINMPFSFSAFCDRLCSVDAQGIYATDARAEGIEFPEVLPHEITPEPGSVIQITILLQTRRFDPWEKEF